MKRAEIDDEIRRLEQDQLKQSAIIVSSDAHACKCGKLGMEFKTTYPEEYDEYVAALDTFHANEERIAELKAMTPEDEEQPIDPVSE